MGTHVNWQDRLLGMRAVEKRFISEKQLTECLNIIEVFEPNKTLEEILLKKGYLTKTQIKRIGEELGTEIEQPGGAQSSKKMFGEIAVDQNMLTQDQLSEALTVQENYLKRGLRIQIGQILAKKGYLTLPQVKRLAETQLKKVLYCKRCKKTVVMHNYDASRIFQCEDCGWDLIEVKSGSHEVKAKKVEDIAEEEDEDIGKLEVLDLGGDSTSEEASKSEDIDTLDVLDLGGEEKKPGTKETKKK